MGHGGPSSDGEPERVAQEQIDATRNALEQASLRAEWELEGFGATAFVEGRNLTDEVYSPTVAVDDAAGRYFQPADGRSLYAGVRWQP